MSYSTIIYEKKGRVAWITLNRPNVLNAMDLKMREELLAAINEITGDKNVDVLVMTGAGRAFCAGRDLKEALRFDVKRPTDPGVQEKIRNLPIPTICAVNGHAVTGGLELVISFDIIIASEKAVFADTHARAGLVPGGGMSQMLPRLVGPIKAKEMSFTGRYVSAREALEIGLVNKVVPHDELIPAAQAMAEEILSCNQEALRKGKFLINKGINSSLEEGLVVESLEIIRWRDSQREAGPDHSEQTREQLLKKARSQSG